MTCLTGIALIEAIAVPVLWTQGKALALVSMVASALCVALAWALPTARAGAAERLWCAVGATGALVLAGWLASRVFAIPGFAWAHDDWTSLPGGIAAALAAISLAAALTATAATPAARHRLASVVVMSQLLALMAGMLFIAHGQEGRAAIGTTTVLASGGHLTSHGSPENSIVFRPLQGGKGGRRQAAPPRLRFSASEMLG